MDTATLVRLRQAPFYKKLLAKLGRVVFVYHDRRPGWGGDLPFYIFKCPNDECLNHERLAIDYPHGFPGSTMRVTCPDCGENKYFPTWKYRLKEIWLLLKLRFKRPEH